MRKGKGNTMEMFIKKIASAFIALCIVAGMFSIPIIVNAEPSAVELTVSSASGKAGDEVKVSINISSNSMLGAAEIMLIYDTSKLTYKSYKQGEAASGSMAAVNPDYKTEGNFKTIFDAFVNADGLNAGGSLLDISFTIKSGWSGATPLVLITKDFVDPIKYKSIAHKTTNGNITVDTLTTDVVTSAATTGTSTETPTSTTTTKPSTTRTEAVTGKDGSKVTVTDKDGSKADKTTVIYDTVTRVEYVTQEGGSIVFETDEAGSTVNKTTVVYERVVGTEYVTDKAGEKVTETDESGSTVYVTTLVYETVDSTDLPDENDTKDNGVMGSLSTAKKTAFIIAFACLILVAAVLVAYTYKKKKDSAK